MDVIQAIHGRRSIRKYSDQGVPEEVVREVLGAAMAAPSAGNQQPWHFITVTDRAVMAAIQKIHPHAGALDTAPVAIVVCADERLEKYKGFWVQDCSAATQNLMLAAYARGLGTVWLGVHPLADRVTGIRALLGLPGSVIPLAVIPLGYPAEKRSSVDRFDDSRVHANKW